MTGTTEAITTMTERARETARAGACVVLAGGIKPSPLASEARSPVLDLWLGEGGSVLEHWLERVSRASKPGAPVRVVHDAKQPAPHAPGRASGMAVSIVAEPRSYRGPAGILADVCADLPEDSTVLLGDAARWLSAAPSDLLEAHAARGASVTVGVNADGSPAGLYALRAGALACVPKKGFMDIKEQWLTRLRADGGEVWTHRFAGDGALPLRTREQFLEAARLASGGEAPLAGRSVWDRAGGAGAWRAASRDASVGEGTSIVESVVMPGAEVGSGAAVVRSILCPGSRVEAGEVVSAQVRIGRDGGRMTTHRGDPPAGGTRR
ncbi:MAG: hypothetical protein ACF8QF_06205 [Phycisphaerales bacterium]